MRKTFLIAVALVGFVPADPAIAGGVQVTSSDATSRFMVLGVSKSVVIDMPMDIRDVLVGNPDTVLAVVRSKRRVYITAGAKAGQTNVYFFDATGRQIGGLDIVVSEDPSTPLPTGPLENSELPATMIEVVKGVDENFNPRIQLLKCAPMCTGTKIPPTELPIHRYSSDNNNNNNNNTSLQARP